MQTVISYYYNNCIVSTIATEDYTPLLTDQFVEIGGGVKTRSCFDITIRDDDVPESIESFELIVAQEDGTSNANVMARNAIVYIQDDDCECLKF